MNGPDSTLTPPGPDSPLDGNESDEKTGMKRKRSTSSSVADRTSEELVELRNEMNQLREQNQGLRAQLEVQSQNNMNMMAQIAELQDALRQTLQHELGAPTAQMI